MAKWSRGFDAAVVAAALATASGGIAHAADPAATTPAIPGDRILTETPGAAALALGRELAENGTLAGLVPLMVAKDTAELEGEYKGLNEAETARLRALSAEIVAAGKERLFAAQARAYAMRLSEADLAVLVAASKDPAQARFPAALPGAFAATMTSVGSIDFKKEVRTAFCKETGKGCDE